MGCTSHDMKNITSAWVIGCGCVLLACASAQRTALLPTQVTLAAQGEVATKRTDNQNTTVEIEVEHLAPPAAVASGATTYVVWTKAVGADARPQNVGAMHVDDDRRGSLKTKTPLERFDVLITPEPSPNVGEPSNEPVMRATVRK